MMSWFIQLLFGFLSSVAFGILTNIPRKALLATGITGGLGWIVYWGLREIGTGLGLANFLAAFLIGLLSIFFSRLQKMPVIIFNIPSLVPLVPGGPAYKAVRELVLGDNQVASENAVIVLVTAAAIAGAFMITGAWETIIRKWIHWMKRKSQMPHTKA